MRTLYETRNWRALVEQASRLTPAQLVEEAEVAFFYADAFRRVGETERALTLAQRIEPQVRRRGNRRLLLNVINLVGMSLFEAGRSQEAEERFSELLEISNAWRDEEYAARACNNLGVLANVRGRRELALTYYQRALASYHRLGYLRGLAQTHHNLGISYRDLGFDREADAHYQRAIRFARAAQSEDVIARAETERALLRARSRDGSLAEALAQRALERFERIGDPLGRAEALRALAAAARASKYNARAADRLEEALAVARAHSDPLLHAEVQRDRGLLLRDEGQLAAAREALLESAEQFTLLGAEAEATAVRATADQLRPDAPSFGRSDGRGR
ncbi:hypothetical protein BH23GEM7_BH23GEM7_08550 [soil metagenome]